MSPASPLSRRALLRAAALSGLAVPAAGVVTTVAGCGPGYADTPDDLLPLLARAEADADAATALAGSSAQYADVLEQVATARRAQADALRSEVDRLNRPRPERVDRPSSSVASVSALGDRLTAARTQASKAVARQPAYRAGLTGSVAAGCAAVQQLASPLGAEQPGTVSRPDTGELPDEAVSALQEALKAEHAAVWVYGLVSAFLPGDYASGIDNGATAHRDRRDACERVLDAAGATSAPAEPAYVPPKPVTGEASAIALVVSAETDAAATWHGVLERTEDAGVRTLATEALVGSATRCTSWRMEAGDEPAAIALPGRTTT